MNYFSTVLTDYETDELSRHVTTLRSTTRPLGWRLQAIQLCQVDRAVYVTIHFALPPTPSLLNEKTKG